MQKSITVDSIIIRFLEQNEGASQILFFIHGNSGSSRMWKKQLQSPALSHYHLIAFDLPGHGNSDALSETQYNVLEFSKILAIAIRLLAQQKSYIIVGFSLGANLAAELLAHNVQPEGIALIGSTVFGNGISLQDALKENNNPEILFTDVAEKKHVENSFQVWCHSGDEQDVQDLIQAYFKTKHPFRSSLLTSADEGLFNDEITLLHQYRKPIFVLFGEDETFSNPYYLDQAGLPLWNEQVYRIPNGSHFIGLDQPEKVNSLLRAYCEQVFTNNHFETHSSTTR